MKPITPKLLAALVLLGSGHLFAQPLAEMIRRALEENYQVRIVKNQAKIAENNNVIGNTGVLPTVDVTGGYSKGFGNSRPEAGGSNLSLLANWPVLSGFTFQVERSRLRHLQELGSLEAKFYMEQTISDLVTAYYLLQYENQLLKNYRQSLAISRFRLALEAKRKDVGAGKAMDYGQALVDFQTDSIRVLTQTNHIRSREIDLNRVLNGDLEKEIVFGEDFLPEALLPPGDSLIALARQAGTLLARQRLQELIAETETRLAKAKYLPGIDLFAGYQVSNTSSALDFSGADSYYGPRIGVNIHFNLFRGGADSRAVKNTELLSQNARLSKQQASLLVEADVRKTHNEYITIGGQISLAESNVREMTKVYQTAEAQLKQGAINGYDFRLTQLTLLNSEQTLMQLRFARKILEINLNRLAGRVLSAYL